MSEMMGKKIISTVMAGLIVRQTSHSRNALYGERVTRSE